jgi:hypothetical protein
MTDIGGILSSLGNMPEIKNVISSFMHGEKDKHGGSDGRRKEHRRCKKSDHKALLCALKPYLSDKRRAAVDPLISALDIFELIR